MGPNLIGSFHGQGLCDRLKELSRRAAATGPVVLVRQFKEPIDGVQHLFLRYQALVREQMSGCSLSALD